VAAGYYRPDLGSTDDGCGHGTHVAGIAAGATYGVAKAARIIPVRVFPGGTQLICQGGTNVSSVIAGVNWVANDHANSKTAVANMSLGATRGYSASLDAAVIALQADGVSATKKPTLAALTMQHRPALKALFRLGQHDVMIKKLSFRIMEIASTSWRLAMQSSRHGQLFRQTPITLTPVQGLFPTVPGRCCREHQWLHPLSRVQ
jgi:hypothetical protein